MCPSQPVTVVDWVMPGSVAFMVTTASGMRHGFIGAADPDGDGGGASQVLVWDALSNLVGVEQGSSTERYVYDASGQRVVRVAGTVATAYVGTTELIDADTSVTGDLTGVRYYTFAGATVALKDTTGWSYLLGDVQGSATVMIPDGDPDTVTVSRNAYSPYGLTRGDDNLATDRGWLGQVEDASTGLTYLNARYYDPVIARFISPDPLMDPGNPLTLDPYMYGANNPVLFMDASGLCYNLTGQSLIDCANAGKIAKKVLDAGKVKGEAQKKKDSCKAAGRGCRGAINHYKRTVANNPTPHAKGTTMKSAPGATAVNGSKGYYAMFDKIAANKWSPPSSVGGVPQVDSTTKCWNYEQCTVVRDAYNVDTVAAYPGAYCDIGPIASWGVPKWAACGGNGAGPALFVGPDGTVQEGNTWDTFAPGDQALITDSVVKLGNPIVGGNATVKSSGKGAPPRVGNPGGLGPNYGPGLDKYSGGSYTSPGWFEKVDGYSDVGGIHHRCWASYSISPGDAAGLSKWQIAAVARYNQC